MAPRALLLSSLVAAGCLDGTARLVREGNTAAEAGRLTEARAAFAKAAGSRPSDARVRVLLGNALAQLHDAAAARAEFAAALERDPHSTEARLGLGQLSMEQRAPEAALEALAPVRDSPEARLLKARALLARGARGDGAAALGELGELHSPEADYLRGSALLMERRFAEAQVVLEAIEPKSPGLSRYGLARLAAAQARPADVLVQLTAAKAALGPRWDPDAVAGDPAFDFIRDLPEFQPLIAK